MGRATYALTVRIGAEQAASYRRNLNKAMKNLDSLESTARRVAAGVATAFAAVNVSRLVEDAVGTYSEFEQAMQNTAAIANATVSDYEKMEAAARAAGRATTKTATESAEAMGYMALAGWNAEESVSGLMPILKLAESTGAELQETSDLVTDSMSALGVGVKDINTYMDMLIAGNNNANTTAIKLMQSLTKTGGASKVLGASLEDTITAVGILANNGTKAEEAGTAMNSMLTRLATNSDALKALEAINVDIFDADGNFIGLRNSLVEIDKALSGMSTEKSTAILKDIAGTRYFSRMEYLLDGVREGADGAASAWDELEQKVINSEGALDKMNKQVTDTLPSAWERVKSAISDTKIGVVDEFGDDATQMLDNIAQKIPEITDNITDFLSDHKKEIYDALETGGELLEKVSNTAVGTVSFLLDNKSAVVGALTSIGAAMLVKRGIDAKNSLVAFASSLTTPLGVIAGLSAAAGVITGVTTAILQASEKTAYANLDEHFGNIVLSLEELQDAADEIVQGGDLVAVTEMLEAAGDTEDELRDVKKALDELEKGSWKIQAGFTFDKDDSELYASKIEDYVGQVQEYMDAKEMEIHVAATLLFGSDSEESLESAKYYDDLDKKIKKLGKKISKSLEDAMEDGVIDADEDAVIQKAIEKMNRITERVSLAQAEAKMQAIQLKYSGSDLDEQTFIELEDEIAKSVDESTDAALQAYESAMTMYNDKLKNDSSYTQVDYDRDKKNAELAFFQKKAQYIHQGTSYLLNTIEQSYPELEEELAGAGRNIDSGLSELFGNNSNLLLQADPVSWQYIMDKFTGSAQLSDSATRGAIRTLYEQLEPMKSQMENLADEYKEVGQEIPQALIDGINEINSLGALSGDTNAIYEMMQQGIGSNEQYQQLLETAREQGAYIPEAISESMDENKVTDKIDHLYQYMDDYMMQVFEKGFEVDTDVKINYNVTSGSKGGTSPYLENKLNTTMGVTPHASGGIFNTPHLGLLAEDGPEAYIPLDGSKNAVTIWEKAGQLLGTMGVQSTDERLYAGMVMSAGTSAKTEAAGESIQIVYNPTINIYGEASKSDVQEAVSLGKDDVLKIMRDYVEGQRRVSFGRK